nr:CRISPR-associated DxTHG motif protein [Aeropyrum camini]
MSSKVVESWLRECENLEHADVEVVPNIGWYGVDYWLRLNIPATGTPFDQAGFFILYYILKHLDSIEDESIDVHLDLTHGLNYLTTLLRDIGPFTATCHAMAKGVDMTLHVYNSEPYPSPRPNNIPRLAIYKVGEQSMSLRTAWTTLLSAIVDLGSRKLELIKPSAGNRLPSSLEETLASARKLYSRTLESVGIYLSSAPLAAYYYSRSFAKAGEEPYLSSLGLLNILIS